MLFQTVGDHVNLRLVWYRTLVREIVTARQDSLLYPVQKKGTSTSIMGVVPVNIQHSSLLVPPQRASDGRSVRHTAVEAVTWYLYKSSRYKGVVERTGQQGTSGSSPLG